MCGKPYFENRWQCYPQFVFFIRSKFWAHAQHLLCKIWNGVTKIFYCEVEFSVRRRYLRNKKLSKNYFQYSSLIYIFLSLALMTHLELEKAVFRIHFNWIRIRIQPNLNPDPDPVPDPSYFLPLPEFFFITS